jgi:hypothetical protein
VKREMAEHLLRLYPARWRERYGEEFAALLEDHPPSIRMAADVLWGALEANMNSLKTWNREPATFSGIIWCAWLAILAAGLNLCATVDDSPFVVAMQYHSLLGLCWVGIELGAVLAAVAIATGGIPIAWAMIRNAIAARRRDLLLRLAGPVIGFFLLLTWGVAVVVLTRGHWAPSPWALAVSRPDWPAASFRWITGSISVFLLLFVLVGSAVCIVQALRRSKFPEVRISLPGVTLQIEPLRFAAILSPWATAGTVVMLVSVLAWGIFARQYANSAFTDHFGPMGVTSFTSWLGSMVLFGAGAMACVPASWHAFKFRSE